MGGCTRDHSVCLCHVPSAGGGLGNAVSVTQQQKQPRAKRWRVCRGNVASHKAASVQWSPWSSSVQMPAPAVWISVVGRALRDGVVASCGSVDRPASRAARVRVYRRSVKRSRSTKAIERKFVPAPAPHFLRRCTLTTLHLTPSSSPSQQRRYFCTLFAQRPVFTSPRLELPARTRNTRTPCYTLTKPRRPSHPQPPVGAQPLRAPTQAQQFDLRTHTHSDNATCQHTRYLFEQ